MIRAKRRGWRVSQTQALTNHRLRGSNANAVPGCRSCGESAWGPRTARRGAAHSSRGRSHSMPSTTLEKSTLLGTGGNCWSMKSSRLARQRKRSVS